MFGAILFFWTVEGKTMQVVPAPQRYQVENNTTHSPMQIMLAPCNRCHVAHNWA